MNQASACYSASAAAALLIGALAAAAVFLAADPICALLGAEKTGSGASVFESTKQYLRGYFLGAPAYLLGQLATPYLQAMGR